MASIGGTGPAPANNNPAIQNQKPDQAQHKHTVNQFPVSLRNRLISGGLEAVLSQTKKLHIVFYPVFNEYKNVQS